MIIKVKVKPSSNKQEIVSFGDNHYLIYLKSEPKDNKANIELIKLLSKHLSTPVNRIKIKFGLKGRDKVIEIK